MRRTLGRGALALVVVAQLLLVMAAPAGAGGELEAGSPEGGGATALAATSGGADPVVPERIVYDTDVASFGVGGLRDRGSGVITVSGITSAVRLALLIWQGPSVDDPYANQTITFNGKSWTGSNIGYADENCENDTRFTTSQAYMANVTGDLNQGNPYGVIGNGSYSVADMVKQSGAVNVNGASLIVFYSDGISTNNKDVHLFVGNDSNVAGDPPNSWNAELTGLSYLSGPATLQLHVSDSSTPDDADLYVNSTVIATGPSIFNGNSVPGGDLWDIKDFDVTQFLNGGGNKLTVVTGLDNECMSLVGALVITPTSGLSVTPQRTDLETGGRANFTATYVDPLTGQPRPDVSLRFSVQSGPNATPSNSGCYRSLGYYEPCFTGPDGRISWTYQGGSAIGEDLIRVFADLNGNGTRESTEPRVLAFATWTEALHALAFGDSYSSGESVTPYDAGTDVEDGNMCHRNSYGAWPSLFTPPGGVQLRYSASTQNPDAFRFIACSGARTYNVYTSTIAGLESPRQQYSNEPVQFANPAATATPAANAAMFTIGGNDAKFSTVVGVCAAFPCTAPGFVATPKAGAQVLFQDAVLGWVDGTADNLAEVYSELRGIGQYDKPVFVMGYPQVFPASIPVTCPSLVPFRNEVTFLRQAGDRLDAVIAQQVAGAGYHFVPVADRFAGHEVCGADGEWINGFISSGWAYDTPVGPIFGPKKPSVESFHPNAMGHYQYAQALEDYVDARLRLPGLVMPNGLPANPDISGVPAATGTMTAAATQTAAVAEATAAVTSVDYGMLTVRPTATRAAGICPDTYLPGESVRVKGGGFAPGASVQVLLGVDGMTGWSDAPRLATVTANASGNIDAVVTLATQVSRKSGAVFAEGSTSSGASLVLSGGITLHAALPVCDRTAPSISISAPQNGATYVPGQEVTVAFSCAAGATDVVVLACIGKQDPGAKLDTDVPGSYSFTVDATVSLGNTRKRTITYTVANYMAGGTANVSITGPVNNAIYGVGEVVNAQYSCTQGTGAAIASCVGSVPSGSANATAAPGIYNFVVRAVDTAGVPTVSSVTYQVAWKTPVVTSVTPATGPAAGGTAITIDGHGFTPTSTVKVGTASATNVVVVSPGRITASTPAGTGTQGVTVTTASGTSNATKTFAYQSAATFAFNYKGTINSKGKVVDSSTANNPGTVRVSFGGTVKQTSDSTYGAYLRWPMNACLTAPTNSSCPEAAINPSVVTGVNPSPATGNFEFGSTIRIASAITGQGGMNLVQRGIFASGQHQWKLQVEWKSSAGFRVASCRFSDGTNSVIVNGTKAIVPGTWYEMSCNRTGNTFTLVVNEKAGSAADETVSSTATIGGIAPTLAPSIGAKEILTAKGRTDLDVDQFHGDMDDIYFKRW